MAQCSGLCKAAWKLHIVSFTLLAILATPLLQQAKAQSFDALNPPYNGSNTSSSPSPSTTSAITSTGIAQFGASVFLGGPWDWEPQQGSSGKSRCMDMVGRISEYTIKYVQFVPTFYWWDAGPKQPWSPGFDPSCSNATLASYYCYSRFNATEVQHWCYTRKDGSCPEVSPSEISSFKSNVGACMKYAASKGLNIDFNARVDDGRSLGGWRNTLDFSPTKKYGSYSYEEVILQPLADILGAAAAKGTQVEFTVQGEMGATVFFHPEEWIEAIGNMRERIVSARIGDSSSSADGGSGTRAGAVLIGLGANNLKACGCEYVGIVDAYEYLSNLIATFDASKYPNLPAVKQAYLAADFIGISAYIPMPSPQFDVCQLEGLLQRMDIELGLYNISLRELTDAGTQLHYSEYGVGGGTSQNGDQLAKTAEEAAYTPFFGIGGSYACSKDSFDMCNPETSNPVREYRRYYYKKSAEYFTQGGCSYEGVKRAFIWGTGSWDVLGIYSGDQSSEGSWTDPVVTEIINCHNAVAQGADPTGSGGGCSRSGEGV